MTIQQKRLAQIRVLIPLLMLSMSLCAQRQTALDVDITGYWTPVLHEDGMERGNGPEIADYGGFALNDAGRLWALSLSLIHI